MDLDSRALDDLADRMTDRLQWVVVNPDHGIGRPMDWSCGDIIVGQEAGDDPTAEWRERVERSQARAYGERQPSHIAATFVMQWYLDVVVNAAAASAGVSEFVVDVSPECLHFDITNDGHFPAAFSVRGTNVQQIPDVTHRRDSARAAYEEHAWRFVDSYRPDAKISSRQRRGMVADLWEVAWEKMARYLPVTALPCRRRLSCCMVYALPGGVECQSCPRLASGSPSAS